MAHIDRDADREGEGEGEEKTQRGRNIRNAVWDRLEDLVQNESNKFGTEGQSLLH